MAKNLLLLLNKNQHLKTHWSIQTLDLLSPLPAITGTVKNLLPSPKKEESLKKTSEICYTLGCIRNEWMKTNSREKTGMKKPMFVEICCKESIKLFKSYYN